MIPPLVKTVCIYTYMISICIRKKELRKYIPNVNRLTVVIPVWVIFVFSLVIFVFSMFATVNVDVL